MTDAEQLSLRLDRIDATLAELLGVLHDIRDPDAAKLRVLIPKIAAVVGEQSFFISDLDIDFDGLSRKQLGKLLERNAHRTIGLHRIEPLRMTREGRMWRLTSVEQM